MWLTSLTAMILQISMPVRKKSVKAAETGGADENKGYSVFDESGKAIYSNDTFTPYLVRVSIDDLNIRKGPGTDYDKTGKHTGKGAFTIVEEAEGEGASLWGLLKSYQKNSDGWISLDYVHRI